MSSKELDKALEEAAKSGERPRKRRGGLRIPSDNVPRSTGEITAPVPEDPQLAVSVAAAFGGTGPVERADLDDDDDDAADDDAVPRESEDEPTGPHGARAPTAPPEPDNGVSASPSVGLAGLAGDDQVELPDGRRPSGDSVEIAFDDEEVAAEARDVGNAAAAAVTRTRAATMALSEEDLEEVMEEVHSGTAAADLDLKKTMPMRAMTEEDIAAAEAELESDEVEGPTDVVPPAPEPIAAPASVAEPEPVAEPVVNAAPAAAPEAEQDPGDSGEIISDDLIEEVDEFAAAAETTVEADASDKTPPPVAEVAAPPPAPPAETKKPPPAPKKGNRAAAVAQAAQAKQRRRRGKPWFEEIFEEDYLRTLPFLTPQATQAEAQFVMSSLGVEPGAQVLDVGCGYGRHAMELAARGFHVVALDASLPLLLRGADEAQRRGLDINFVHGDMRELTFDAQFDGAYCLFSTFGYFDDETNKKAAQHIARALKPGARLVVEVLNRDYLIADLPSRVWWEGDGCVVLEEVEFNYFSSRIISNRSVVFDDGRQLEQEISIRAYSLHEFGKLLHAAGFRVVEISGSMITRGRFFGNHSRDIIVVAERRTPGE